MKALIIYDTVFGNTEQIARAISEGFGMLADVRLVKVGAADIDMVKSAALVIAGSPTRGFSSTPAMKKFLESIPRNGLKGIRVAAFDTRIIVKGVGSLIFNPLAKVFGYAAEPIAEALVEKGGQPAAQPEGFFVVDSEGPLRAGERERAKEWGRRISGR